MRATHDPPVPITTTKTVDEYRKIVQWCRNVAQFNKKSGHHNNNNNINRDFLFHVDLFHSTLEAKCREFQFPVESMLSLLYNEILHQVKITASRTKDYASRRLVNQYMNNNNNTSSNNNNNNRDHSRHRGPPITLLQMAKQVPYPAYLLSRWIVESLATSQHLNLLEETGLSKKKFLQNVFENPDKVLLLLSSTNEATKLFRQRLARDIHEIMEQDPMFGPKHTQIRQRSGSEYEVLLEEILNAKQIPFETEDDLRERGTARTPDVLLLCPVAINIKALQRTVCDRDDEKEEEEEEWRPICWIDSKAFYGDVLTHEKSVLPQAHAFMNRFGPGLVIYWFGHAPCELLETANGDLVLANGLEEDALTFLMPTGQIV